jgi:hypothetical protein
MKKRAVQFLFPLSALYLSPLLIFHHLPPYMMHWNYFGAMCLVFAGATYLSSRIEARQQEQAQQRVEKFKREGHPVPPDGVTELLLRGKKIQAIALYRKQTGVGLKEAKDTVEAMEAAWQGR